jgi:hypothetical protein
MRNACPAVPGNEAGAEDAGSGEHLAEAEALDLQYALYDLDGKTRRAVGMDEFVTAVQVRFFHASRSAG